MDIAKIIADNLTDWMNSTPALDTFKKLSTKSGVGFGTVQRAKNGDGNITVEKLAAIAQAFGRAPADLLLSPKREGTPEGSEQNPSSAAPATPPHLTTAFASPRTAKIIERLLALDQSNKSPDALYVVIENALNLIQPIASKDDYNGVDDLVE